MNISELPSPSEVLALIDGAKTPQRAYIYALLYMTGARPSEARQLTPAHFRFGESEMVVFMPTLKKPKRGQRFTPKYRQIIFDVDSWEKPYPPGVVRDFVTRYAYSGVWNIKLYPYTLRTLERHLEEDSIRVLGRKLVPYHLRHLRSTLEGSKPGANINTLMQLRGDRDPRAAAHYLHFVERAIRLTDDFSVVVR